MDRYEVIYTGGGIWLSLLHKNINDTVLTYCVSNDYKDCLSCYVNIGVDYDFYEDNMVFSYGSNQPEMKRYTKIYKQLLENLEKGV